MVPEAVAAVRARYTRTRSPERPFRSSAGSGSNPFSHAMFGKVTTTASLPTAATVMDADSGLGADSNIGSNAPRGDWRSSWRLPHTKV